jgi:GAF domain-containing protein
MKTLASSLGAALERSRRRETELRRLRQLAELRKITGRIAGRTRVSDHFADILTDVDTMFDFNGTTLGLVRGNEMHFYTSHSGVRPGEAPDAIVPVTRGITGRVVRTGEPAFVRDVDADPDFIRFRPDLRQEICVPIRVEGEVTGVLDIEMDDRRQIDEGDFDIVQTLADHIALAIANQRRLDELERRARDLRTVERVTAVIAGTLLIHDAAGDLLDEIEDAFGYGTTSIAVIEGDRLRFLAIRQNVPGDHSRFQEDGLPVGTGVTGRVALTGVPAFLRNVRDDPDYLPTSSEIEYEICVPIVVEGRTVGVLNVETPASSPLDEQDFEVISIIANHLGMAIAKSELYMAEMRSRRAMEALQRVSSIVASTLNTDEALRRIVETLAEAFAYPVVAFRVLAGDELVPSAAVGLEPDSRPAIVRLGEGVVGSVAMTGQPRFLPDVTQEPAFVRIRDDVTSEVCVPVGFGGRLVGVLNVEGTAERPLTAHDLQLLQSFAEHAGILLNNARLYEQLQTLASQDSTTDLPNLPGLQRRLR